MTATARKQDWSCQAYGDNPYGWCFFEEWFRCYSRRICEARLEVERRRIWDQLQNQRLVGDDQGSIAAEILAGISGPDELLNGELGPQDREA